MSYVVYHVATTMVHRYYDTLRGARVAATRLNRKFELYDCYLATSVEDYNKNVVKMIRVKNLMTGQMVEIPSNTPYCCNPATESYWSM